MHKVLIVGAGRVGSLIAMMLSAENDFHITLVDQDFQGRDVKRIKEHSAIDMAVFDITSADFSDFVSKQDFIAVISCLPYFCNKTIAKLAKQCNINYFDLTEDVEVTGAVKKLAEKSKTAFVPQCGLAPGFITICANSLIQQFEQVDSVKLRVGALPVNSNHALQYSLTWSTEGLINEYASLCKAIESGEKTLLAPLAGLEPIQIDGLQYEAFNTSGGLGSLVDDYVGKIDRMNYKSIRYPGHCEKMRFLMCDLKLKNDQSNLKAILENALPKTYQDVVIVYVSIVGKKQGELYEDNYVKKVYPQEIAGFHWSALQVTTAAGVCGVVDLVLNSDKVYQGLVHPHHFSLDEFLQNRFGQYYLQQEV